MGSLKGMFAGFQAALAWRDGQPENAVTIRGSPRLRVFAGVNVARGGLAQQSDNGWGGRRILPQQEFGIGKFFVAAVVCRAAIPVFRPLRFACFVQQVG